MKDIDIHISARRVRRETVWLAVCVLLVEILNAWAIAAYDTPWTELVTSLGYVVAAGIVLYVALAVLRFVVALAIRNRRAAAPEQANDNDKVITI